MRNLIIADRQDITKVGIRYIIDNLKTNSIGSVFVADDKEFLLKILSEYPESMVLLDYTLFDFSSITELQILQERYPESSWMLFSDELTDSFLRQMLTNDLAFTIVFKSAPLSDVESAIVSTLEYVPYWGKNVENHIRILRRSIDDLTDHNLTNTEKEILKEMALGRTTKEIAAGRNVSFHTIITHRKNIFRKLDVNNVHEATKYAMKAGIVDLSEYYI